MLGYPLRIHREAMQLTSSILSYSIPSSSVRFSTAAADIEELITSTVKVEFTKLLINVQFVDEASAIGGP
ncbi:hypothetical protein HanIR_Chr13g0626991 [Helianthus annuus]|nr:hypothetical protein HanIR_Chr13g0626991 [Helianthus annuus]